MAPSTWLIPVLFTVTVHNTVHHHYSRIEKLLQGVIRFRFNIELHVQRPHEDNPLKEFARTLELVKRIEENKFSSSIRVAHIFAL